LVTDEVRENHRPRVVGSRASTVQVHPLASLPSVIDLMHAAALLGLGRTTAYKLVRKGEWPTPIIRIGRPIKIPTAPIRELLSRSNGSRSN
jgi:excisionase family DNA binding protein